LGRHRWTTDLFMLTGGSKRRAKISGGLEKEAGRDKKTQKTPKRPLKPMGGTQRKKVKVHKLFKLGPEGVGRKKKRGETIEPTRALQNGPRKDVKKKGGVRKRSTGHAEKTKISL